MTLQDTDHVLFKNNLAEVVGRPATGHYDILRFADNRVIRYVPRNELEQVR